MFLGVDGGGTTTAYALIDVHGHIRATHVAASASHLNVGFGEAAARLLDGVRTTLAAAHLAAEALDFAFFGLAAYGENEATVVRLDRIPALLLDAHRYRCGNDMLASWAGSLACADGISVIAGTGSLAYGEYSGRSARAGGWGELIGDEGSAYWIAREGLNLFSRMSDGRAPRGLLHTLVREHFGLAADLELCAQIYGLDADARGTFAQLARLVHAAADSGDTGACTIFAHAGRELAELACAVRRELIVPDALALPVSWSGGAFGGSQLLLESFSTAIDAASVPFDVRAPLLPPALGAALYAARLAGRPLDADALATLRAQVAAATLPA
jgi:N-acetylglucosamine kinase-like BadF-type ATPase